MEAIYGQGSQEMDDILVQMPGQPPATEIIDNYIKALGGAQKVSAIKSYVGTGTSVGFGGFGGGGHVRIYAKAPDHRTTYIKFEESTGRGESIRTYNGKTGWIKTPLTILGQYETYGGELAGAKVDAEMSFPGQIKQVLSNLVTSLPATINDLPGPSAQTANQTAEAIGKDRVVNVVQGRQGTAPNITYVTMYFDQETGLLLRMVRYAPSPIGRVPTQMDFGDYRDVGGVKMPFRLTFAWLDGRDAIQLTDIKTNVPIDEKIFGTPEEVKATAK
jgi:hypothetical protein